MTDIRATGADRAGSVLVAASPRSWELLTAPVRVAWFPSSAHAQALVRPALGSRLRPTQQLELAFSRPVADLLGSGYPQLTPATAGHWRTIDGYTIAFQPAGAGFGIGAHVEVTLPEPLDVIAGARTRSTSTLAWQVPDGSTLRLQQLLAELGYLPLAWQAAAADVPRTVAAEAGAAGEPPAGSFSWLYANTPSAAARALEAGRLGNHDAGGGDGVRVRPRPDRRRPAGTAGLARASDRRPGREELGSRVQLRPRPPEGSADAPALARRHDRHEREGEHRRSRGPDAARDTCGFRAHPGRDDERPEPGRQPLPGSGIKWISYFNHGEAIHGFNRPTYGFPQSVGCVEAPDRDRRGSGPTRRSARW